MRCPYFFYSLLLHVLVVLALLAPALFRSDTEFPKQVPIQPVQRPSVREQTSVERAVQSPLIFAGQAPPEAEAPTQDSVADLAQSAMTSRSAGSAGITNRSKGTPRTPVPATNTPPAESQLRSEPAEPQPAPVALANITTGIRAPRFWFDNLTEMEIDRLLLQGHGIFFVTLPPPAKQYLVTGTLRAPDRAYVAYEQRMRGYSRRTLPIHKVHAILDRVRLDLGVPAEELRRAQVFLAPSHGFADRLYARQQEAARALGIPLKNLKGTSGRLIWKNDLPDYEIRSGADESGRPLLLPKTEPPKEEGISE